MAPARFLGYLGGLTHPSGWVVVKERDNFLPGQADVVEPFAVNAQRPFSCVFVFSDRDHIRPLNFFQT